MLSHVIYVPNIKNLQKKHEITVMEYIESDKTNVSCVWFNDVVQQYFPNTVFTFVPM